MGSAGALTLSVYPVAKDWASALAAQTIAPSAEVGGKAGRAYSDAFASQTTRGAAEAKARLEATAQQTGDAVARASQTVVTARAREEAAAGKVRIAEQQLNEARGKYAAGSSQVMSAEERLATAHRNVGVASGNTEVAERNLAATKGKATRASQDLRAGVESESGAMDKFKTIASGSNSTIGNLISQYGKLGAAVGIAVVIGIGIKAVSAAADFQQSQERLVTTAGETRGALKGVSDGILSMAGQVGYSAQDISKGMYTVESAGFHGAEALAVMKASAQGAKMENADLGTVTNAVTSVIRDYGLKASDAGVVTSKLVTAVSLGKTNFQDLTGSLSAVLPKAAAVGLSMSEVTGDLASMTLHGMSAQQSADNLADAITHLVKPTLGMTAEMASLGLNSADLSKNLGKNGVQGTMEQISTAIMQHMGPAGTTLLNAFNQSKVAATDANTMFKSMPSSLQGIAKSYQDGAITSGQFRSEMKNVPADQRMLMQSFKSITDRANGFNSALKSGSSASQTYAQALAAATGDSASMNVALMLTGTNGNAAKDAISKIGKATTEAGGNVKGWSEVQGTFNQKISEIKAGMGAWVIDMGTKLLPVLTGVAGAIQNVVNWITQNKTWIGLLMAVIGGALGVMLAFKIASLASAAATWIMTQAQAALTAVMDANPFVLVAIAIGALVAGVIYAYNHFAGFRHIVEDIGNFFKTVFLAVFHAVGDAVGWVVAHWKIFAIVLGILFFPLGLLVGVFILIFKHLHEIGEAAKWVYDHAIKPAFDAIAKVVKTVVDAVVDAVKKFVGKLVEEWRKISGPVIEEWNKIKAKLEVVWNLLVTLWNDTGGKLIKLITDHMGTIKKVIEEVWKKITDIFGPVLKVIIDILKVAWDYISTVLRVAWDIIVGIFKYAFDVIKGVVTVAWDIIKGIFKVAWDIISGVVGTALDIIKGIIKIFIDIVTGKWGKLWTDIKDLFGTIGKDIWNIIKKVFGDIWDTIKHVMGDLWKTLTDVWNTIKDTVLNVAKDIWKGLKSGIQDAVNVIGAIWDGLKKALGEPIWFVIHTILNDGIIAGINLLLNAVGLGPHVIPDIPDKGIPHFATGGVIPGYAPGHDTVHALLSPGEGVLVPAAVQALGGAQGIHAINTQHGGGAGPTPAAGGLPGYGLGGFIGDILGGIANAAKAGWDAVKNVALGMLRAAASGFFDGVVKPLVGLIPGSDDNAMKKYVKAEVNKVETSVLDFLGQKDTSSGGGTGSPVANVGSGVTRWTPQVLQSLAALGQPASWLQTVLRRMNQESGGNPNAINNTDSNAQAGHPSQGLMQTIPGTFNAYRNPAWSTNILDPLNNIYAGENYAIHRYGSLAGMDRPGGYDNGGWLMPGQLGLNTTSRPEPVISPTQWDALQASTRGGENGSGATGSTTHQYFITSHDPTSVAYEIERRETLRMRTAL